MEWESSRREMNGRLDGMKRIRQGPGAAPGPSFRSRSPPPSAQDLPLDREGDDDRDGLAVQHGGAEAEPLGGADRGLAEALVRRFAHGDAPRLHGARPVDHQYDRGV